MPLCQGFTSIQQPMSSTRRRLPFDRSPLSPAVQTMITASQQPPPQSRRSSSGGAVAKSFILAVHLSIAASTTYNTPINIDLKAMFGSDGCIEGRLETVPASPVIIQPMQDNDITSTEIKHEDGSTSSSDPSVIAGKEKTPMCLVNELARYNKIEHQYRLTSEDGPPHKKKFTVTLKLGTEEYTADGPSIKKAQHSAAGIALKSTQYKHPPPKVSRNLRQGKGNITPTVELNALAMKRGEPTIYTFLEMPQYNQFDRWGIYSQSQNGFSQRWKPVQTNPQTMSHQRYYGGASGKGPYKVTVKVGEREFSGEGVSAQAARHDAAAKALHTLRNLPLDSNITTIHHTGTCDSPMIDADSSSELKSPISLVHEIALKRNLPVLFEVISEKGPPHMRTFVTRCVVGDKFDTTGEGNGKKISKKRAAEQMLERLRTLPPTTTVTAVGCANSLARIKRKTNTAKKKSRNLIKDTVVITSPPQDQKYEPESIEEVNPISRLIQIQQAKREKEPVYTLREERGGISRRRGFLMEVSVGEHSYLGSGPNKKIAKRNAAEGLLQMLGYANPMLTTTGNLMPHNKVRFSDEKTANGGGNGGGTLATGSSIGGGVHGRQLAPGLLLVPEAKTTNGQSQHKHPSVNLKASATIAQEYLNDGSSPTADALGHNRGAAPPTGTIRPKEQLNYLAKLSNFHIQFSDFPKGNHSEFLSLVTLDTDPPHVCHGNGATIDISQDQAALNALRSLSKMGLDSISTPPKKEQQINPGSAPEGLYLTLQNSITKDDSYINGK